MARRTSPQTRVKLSRAAKKRKRAPKGSPYAGRFVEGIQYSARPKISQAGSEPYRGKGSKNRGSFVHGTSGSEKRQQFEDAVREVHHGEISPRQAAYHITRSRLMGEAGPDLGAEDMPREPSTRVRQLEIRNIDKMRREGNWQAEGVYKNERATKGHYIPLSQFISKEMSPLHRAQLEKELSDPSSAFNAGLDVTTKSMRGRFANPAQRRRVEQYVQQLQLGKSHAQAQEYLREERRGRARRAPGLYKRTPESVGIETEKSAKGRKSRYESVTPSKREFQIGVSSPRVDRISELSKKFPDKTEKQLVQTREFQRMHIGEELTNNSRWARETQRANILGQERGKGGQTPDRVVFFTTNLGKPAFSIPSDSLVGQYIIRQRKNMLRKEGIARGKELQGSFPPAVRDMHLVEASTGYAVGAEGRYGAFHRTAWRTKGRKSRNFGKSVPVGSQILYDSTTGRPLFDEEGNIRYSEGVTRPFKFETTKDLGARVFIG